LESVTLLNRRMQVPTTRALSLVATGDQVCVRERRRARGGGFEEREEQEGPRCLARGGA
jgi:hypothetical protein